MRTHNSTIRKASQSSRSGLAPLELVLSLPIMLFVMALIIDFGNMAPWKVRASVVAREAVWRENWPHRGGGNPRPAGWPANNSQQPTAQTPTKDASLSRGAAHPDILNSDPFAKHTIVRGPMALQNSPIGIVPEKVDFPTGMVQGMSHIEIRLPLLPRLPHTVYDLRHQILDDKFTYGEMGYSRNSPVQGLDTNDNSRRSLRLFQVPQADQSKAHLFSRAVQDVLLYLSNTNPTEFTPTTSGVLTLKARHDTRNGDDEFIKYQMAQRPSHPEIRTRPGLAPPCDTDREAVRIIYVLPTIDKIQGRMGGGKDGVPDDLASDFIGLYQHQIDLLKQQQPVPQSQIDFFQAKIDQLNQFKRSLQ